VGLIRPAGLALLALAGVVLALHMLRVQRIEQRVPSTWLWRRLVLDPPASQPWRRPPASLLLALQLAVVSLLALAFARPFLFSDRAVGESLVILLDHSASMAATDVEPNRLEQARRALQVRAEEALSAGARVTVVAFADETEVLLAGSNDAAAVRRALASVRVRPVRGRLNDALGLAGALAEGQAQASILLATDGALDSEGMILPDAPLEWLPVGSGDNNQSIAAFTVDIRPDGVAEIFVRVANHGRSTVQRRVLIEDEAALLDARDLSMPLGADAAYVIRLSTPVQGALTARLAGEDLLAMDDVAYAVPPRGEGARIGLLSSGNRFLETALALLPGVDSLTTREPSEETPFGRIDVIVADGAPPAEGATPLLLVRPPTSMPGLRVAGQLDMPRPVLTAATHPLAVPGLAETAILSAVALELDPGWQTVLATEVEGKIWPLLAEGVVAGRPSVVIAFDLRDSDLPLRSAFPLLMAAVLDHLAPTTAVGLPVAAAPGVPLAMRVPPRVTGVEVQEPDGSLGPLEVEQGDLLWLPQDIGIHQLVLSLPGGEAPLVIPLAVSPALGEGSDIRVRPIDMATVDKDAGDGGQRGRRELWSTLVWVALLLGGAEWLFDHRGRWPDVPTAAAIRRRLPFLGRRRGSGEPSSKRGGGRR